MKEAALKKLDLIEKEVATLADKIEETDEMQKAVKDILKELKGIKVFLSRVHPEFKSQFPAIIKKVRS